ncbi:SIMPL domain-containing protein [Streptomyces smaragdinus]|uniref:SIMPL domain-containing protein n=1 Tax=Streptomyces smaragdinus TaxID=2585196 RepID=UPI002B1E9731|nr:SIMPL domain-containing protein [Streptomyces smaragdinus]
MRRIVTLVLGALLLALPTATTAVAAPRAPEPVTVAVTGEGSATSPPDAAVLNAGVEVTGETVAAAMAAQNTAARAFLDAVAAQGIADGDVRTDGMFLGRVDPPFNPDGSTTGYRAGQSFTVTVRDIARIGDVITAVSEATGNAGHINGISFDVADRHALEARARVEAFADARAKAEQYAVLAGGEVGRLVSVSEDGAFVPPAFRLPPSGAGETVPVAPGEVTSTVTVYAVYELT